MTKERTIFEELVDTFKAKRVLEVEDAETPLELPILKKHCENAKRCDASCCVVAQALSASQVGFLAASVTGRSLKVLIKNGKGGTIYRYEVSSTVGGALRTFDKTGQWELEPGTYVFKPHRESGKLMKNKSEKEKNRQKKNWANFEQKFKEGKSNGNGHAGGKDGGGPQVNPTSFISRAFTKVRELKPKK